MIRRTGTLFILMILCLCLSCAGAEGFDAEQYTYDELLQIREKVDIRLAELERQYAAEHPNRQIVFDEPEQNLTVRQKIQVTPKIERLADDAPQATKVNWTSSDENVATVNDYGRVTAVGRGDAVITATAKDADYISGSFTVHVIVPVDKITVWGQETPLLLSNNPEDATAVLEYGIEPEDAFCQDVIWQSSDESTVTVDANGTIHGLQPGTAVITATSAVPLSPEKPAVSAKYTVTVQQAVTGITLSESEMNLSFGKTATLSVTVEPEDAGNRNVIFSSSNPEVAEADADGNIRATGSGECEILCVSADGSGAEARCRVSVIRQVEGLETGETEIRLGVGETYEVPVTVTPEDATNPQLRWTSSNVLVARAADGKIEGLSQGFCDITCATTDGSNLKAKIRVVIPTFSVTETEYTVTEKSGLVIPLNINQPGCQIELACEAECFEAELDGANGVQVTPISAGTGTITLSNPEEPADTIVLQITIENSAVYNAESYPPFAYDETMLNPDAYADACFSAAGKVLQISREESGTADIMLGTGGEGLTDQVLLIHCPIELTPADLKTGDIMTVYGTFRMDEIYSEVLQTSTQIPAMNAEKIIVEETEPTQE